ncbi:MAG: VWA domain-containing protein [Planctomycetaceae bacterium]|jgi:Ca-activated chloride channel family protein|nr:VWA domain-containing protein [Planctomycetaceae bacterium]
MFRFQSPYYFLFLIPLAILVIILEFRRSPASVVFSDVSLLRFVPRTFVQQCAVFVSWLFYLGMVLWIAALARPQSGKEEYRIRAEGIAMALCVDRSGSMAAIDFTLNGQRVNRLEAVKKTFHDFVAGNSFLSGRKDDLIGLLAFGGYVDAFCPLTLDHATLLEMLAQIRLPEPIVDDQGNLLDRHLYEEENMTAIGDALAQAVDRLKNIPAKSKVIILLSDGEQTFGTLTPLEGAETAKAFGIKVYTIGIGTTGEAPYIVTDSFGQQRITVQNVAIDEETLKKIAELTGGQYFNAQNTHALEQVYAEIDQLEKTTHEGRTYTQYTELFHYPLITGTVLILLHLILICTRFRRLP